MPDGQASERVISLAVADWLSKLCMPVLKRFAVSVVAVLGSDQLVQPIRCVSIVGLAVNAPGICAAAGVGAGRRDDVAAVTTDIQSGRDLTCAVADSAMLANTKIAMAPLAGDGFYGRRQLAIGLFKLP